MDGLPSPTVEEKKNLKVPIPQARLLDSSRVAAVLHVCSAFEHAVASYFALCLLYRPEAYKKTKSFAPLPQLLADSKAFQNARAQAQKTADEVRGGDYTVRLGLFGTKFGVDVSWIDAKLDQHQLTRHKIAHDQALDGADDPALSSGEVITLWTKLTETEWKRMLGLFWKTIDRLDVEITRYVATDHGLSLAVSRTMEKEPTATYDAVFHAILNEWRIPAMHRRPADVLYRMGLVEEGRGKKTPARDYLQRSLKLQASPEVEAALKRLNKMK